ncbi:paired amphipathic helix protein Sin3-like 5 isoform X2 [Dendrobium catenatum]|uniref:paired amphipathic helix protein Sin3-like 5 isoform X2 n=1 Tax=Dendrobium catenatum TaxID=906689 RepID=UPI00109EF207|nr:paired amphipathic helix protein Sin3-like 5 isoform X2 [Dendrobium catenatum]
MASDMDTTEQKLTTSDALAYLKCVKDLFKDNKEKYNEFLEVMRDFKSQRTNTNGVIMRVQELFKGHSDLILGFSKFLPNGYEIKVPVEKKPVEFHEAFTFVSKIKSRFENDQLTYRSFLDTLEMYRNHTKSSSEVRREVALLFKNHEDLFMEFLHFLPDTTTSTAQLVSPARRFARRDKFRTMKPPCMQKDRDMDREHEKRDANMTVESVKYREDKQINQGSSDFSKDVANHKVSLSPSIMDYKDLDLSNCPSCTPSYRLLPENCRAPVSSDRTELDKSVLNDVWVSVTSRTEDYSSNPSRKSQYEESLFKCEDDRYELDMLVESANTTVEKVQNLVKKMQDDNDINKLESPFRIEDHLTSRNLNCIERLYGDNGFDAVDALKKNASVALPRILDRLKQKQEEWTTYRANFNKHFLLRSKKSIRRKCKK